MSLNSTPSSERIHIGFFGRRNAGKSSLVNAVTGQELAVVSDVLGTTTDPVKKAMELLPLGPVVIIDTPGFDDSGSLGELRVKKTREILAMTDVAVLVTDASTSLSDDESEFVALCDEKKLPLVIAHNKVDLESTVPETNGRDIWVSANTKVNVDALKEKIAAIAKSKENTKKIVADLLNPGDTVILVVPIDESAPKGRLILPQQQTIRDIIDAGCMAYVCQPEELPLAFAALKNPPKLVITDSQAFGRVSKLVPAEIPLTSFSILFARYKGDLMAQVKGAAALSSLRDGDAVLIAEGCTHHRQCGDIGTVKLPRWIEEFTGAKPEYTFTSGGSFPEDLSRFKLIIHCGACMLNEAEMQHRISRAKAADAPFLNYGLTIAHTHGILRRSLEIFPEALALLDK